MTLHGSLSRYWYQYLPLIHSGLELINPLYCNTFAVPQPSTSVNNHLLNKLSSNNPVSSGPFVSYWNLLNKDSSTEKISKLKKVENLIHLVKKSKVHVWIRKQGQNKYDLVKITLKTKIFRQTMEKEVAHENNDDRNGLLSYQGLWSGKGMVKLKSSLEPEKEQELK